MKEKKKSSNKLNLIICGIAFVVMVLYIVFVDGVDNLINSIQQFNVGFLFIAILFMVAYWLLEAVGLHAALKTIHPEQKFWKTLVVALLGQYFNCITPSSSGGQPMQVYYFAKFGTPVSHSMTALLSKFIVYQFVLTVYSAVVLILRFSSFAKEFAPLMALVVFGFIVNTVVIVLLLMVAFTKKPVKKLAFWGIRVLGKLRILKTQECVDEKIEQVDKIIEDYHDNFCFIKSKPGLIVRMVLYTILQLTIYFAISYVIFLGFGLSGTDLFTIISCQAFVLMISAFMPLPGAMGAAEGSYAAFFGKIFGKFTSFSTFIWRFLTFYFPIIVGLILSLFVGKMMGTPEDDHKLKNLDMEDIKGDEI
ncbi:MAG: flippase-like domain-containing protein [Ruminiclostridium sp.]|nr:flippase-like domain-containing protein [Ruminiclostridium sp.]